MERTVAGRKCLVPERKTRISFRNGRFRQSVRFQDRSLRRKHWFCNLPFRRRLERACFDLIKRIAEFAEKKNIRADDNFFIASADSQNQFTVFGRFCFAAFESQVPFLFVVNVIDKSQNFPARKMLLRFQVLNPNRSKTNRRASTYAKIGRISFGTSPLSKNES